ncbi:MAG: ornithine cyclodeaminase [Clostridiales bacterium]|nr:ornithine cyclodeaminase [Clostridiales bacterium]
MKTISFNTVRNMGIDPAKCYEWVSDTILRKKETLLPAKIHMDLPGSVFCNVMPSIIREKGMSFGGVKIVTRYPERQPSLDSKIILFDAESGEMLALMDGNWITAMRTGAVAAHSIMLLAKKEFSTVSMIGLGNVARSSLLVLAAVSKRQLHIRLLRYKDQAERFIERFDGFENISFSIVDSVEECIKGTDVVLSCATYFENDIARPEWFDEGVLVVPVHTRGFMNCDLFFDKVFADDYGHVCHFKYFDRFRSFAEVSDVVNGSAKGRENDYERILAYNIGLSIHDVKFAANIYRIAVGRGIDLQEIALEEPTEKFWI